MPSDRSTKNTRLIEYMQNLQSSGHLTFTKATAMSALAISEIAFNRAAERLAHKNQLVQPSRGFFVIVPSDHKSVGAPPVSWFIDDLMKYHGQPYYVGILTAAAFHGAAHQAPQEFQVVTNKPIRQLQVGRARIHFLCKKEVERTPTQPLRTPYGDIPITTPEATAFDLLKYIHRAGGLSNVATVLIELSETIDPKKLVTAAKACKETPIIQRIGYLLDTYGDPKLTSHLHQWVFNAQLAFTKLRPNWSPPGHFVPEKVEKWKLVVNETVEPDL